MAFLTTLCIELAIYFCRPCNRWITQSKIHPVYLCLLVNLCTHPFIFVALPSFVFVPYWEYVAMAELIALLGEWYVLGRFGVAHPFKVSLVANLFSWQLGTVVVGFFGAN